MSKTVAYIRASTNAQDVKNQRHEILAYGNREEMRIDEFIEVTVSSRHSSRKRRIEELRQRLQAEDSLVVTELSRLGRSTGEVITKEALAAKKAQGVLLGKPKGTIQASMYDKDRERIRELLSYGVPQKQIVERHLGYGTTKSLSYYIRTRGLRSLRSSSNRNFSHECPRWSNIRNVSPRPAPSHQVPGHRLQ